ncbi:MAG: DUF1729 domain-containing protein [Deltaproteobacteria bacterium]|nr:DUF1729 domain-containing protein [Deltaproteobacteria bacterium]
MTTQFFGASGVRVPQANAPSSVSLTGPIALTFAGQASDYLDELAGLRRRSHRAAVLIDALLEDLELFVSQMPREDAAFFASGMAAREWLRDANSRPDPRYLQSVPVSFPLIFVTQLAHFERLRESGITRLEPGIVRAAAGHSQGIMAAVAASVSWQSKDLISAARVLAPLGMLFALRMQQAWPMRTARIEAVQSARRAGLDVPTAMAAVTGLLRAELDAQLAEAKLASAITCTLDNTLFRQVISGTPEILERFRESLVQSMAAKQRARKERTAGGRAPEVQWQYLPVSAPFHSDAMAPAMERLYRDAEALGFRWTSADLAVDVLDTEHARAILPEENLIERLITLQCVRPVHWRSMCDTLVNLGVRDIVDCGPGDALSKLTFSNLRGAGIALWPMSAERTLSAITAQDPDGQMFARGASYPQTLCVANSLANPFVALTGCPPIVLAGMTPTTVEAPIVAAAANGGYVAELAGGGQVTESILRARMDELRELLEPGRSVVFNALYLDPYLWKLHLAGPRPLIVRLADEGYPIAGVTVSAGVPVKEEAVALWRLLNDAGLRVNSLKPGNDRELKEALAIAAAVPDLPVILQIEGGHAGGHHSWEDLDDLLLRHYPAMRAQSNVIVAVGGGIGTPERAATYIDGSWAHAYGARAMPVDAVFVGTCAMACLEARTSPQVKRALVAAAGTDRWIADSAFVAGVTSGRSQLDASVYYLDTSASRAGRLLDRYAGNESAVALHRDEIIAALAKTARPYFGDVESMSYAQWLDRLVSLTAVGRGSRYEDGCWPDGSYRQRMLKAIQIAEARLSASVVPFESHFAPRDLDDPRAALARLLGLYPEADQVSVHPQDALAFVALCRLPGKPVNFVPVIDAEVRRWYKADSLWHAHDDRFEADQVLALPGPRSLAAITAVDEPVAELLQRFERSMRSIAQVARLPDYVTTSETLVATETDVAQPERWLARLTNRSRGPVCAMIHAQRAVNSQSNRTSRNPLRALLAPTLGDQAALVRASDGALTSLRISDAQGRVRLSIREDACSLRSYGPQGREGSLDLSLSWDSRGFLAHDSARHIEAQRGFYQQMIFGGALASVARFDTASHTVTVAQGAVAAFAYATGDEPGLMLDEKGRLVAPLSMTFALCWEPIFAALDGAQADVTRLVHESLSIEAGAGGPIAEGMTLQCRAQITSLDQTSDGDRVTIEATLHAEGGLAAKIVTSFFVRKTQQGFAQICHEEQNFVSRIALHDESQRALLRSLDFVSVTGELCLGARYVLRCDTLSLRQGTALASGRIETLEGEVVATIACDRAGCVREHPVTALASLLSENTDRIAVTPSRALLEESVTAPRSMSAYALASGDRNPLHLDAAMATLAGLDAPIVHGMWTASVAAHRAMTAAQARPGAMARLTVRFESPVSLGEMLAFRIEQVALAKGGVVLGLLVQSDASGDTRTVLRGEAELAAPRTAYLFPGQGIQRAGMGMTGYARSSAARGVWDEADAHCRSVLGFSLLRVVRENPTELVVRGERFAHPQGVLFLTQFTQAALVVLAVAQVAELRAQGAFVEDAMMAGHSLGEYSALTAVAGVVPLRAAVEVVYARGLTMDRLVPRDRDGRTPYAMRVIRPNLVDLDDDGLRALINECAAPNEPLEIVNFNVRGRQYSVTGDVRALARMHAAISARSGEQQARKALVVVPGVDVPFHSTLLREGVDRFRKTLTEAFPESLDARVLVGRYVPNLTGRLFSIDRSEISKIADETGSPALAALLVAMADVHAVPSEQQVARVLLIELLAYQFASPVRWIDTQELLFSACALDRCIEVGLAEQPTIMNMAQSTLAILGRDRPRAMNSELHGVECLGPKSHMSDTPATSPVATVSKPNPVAPQVPATSPVLTSPPKSAGPVSDLPFTSADGLRVLLALQARVRLEQIRDDETLDELLGGNSARRNQLLADLGQEFALGPMDGAHEIPIRALSETIASKSAGYSTWGKYLSASLDQRISAALAPSRVSRAEVTDHLAQHWSLGAGHLLHLLARLALQTRTGDSTRGGSLATVAANSLTDRASVLQGVDALVAEHASARGLSLAPVTSHTAGATVDSAALDALEAKILGPEGVVVRSAQAMLEAAGRLDLREVQGPVITPESAALDAVLAEHDEAYLALTKGVFSAEKCMTLTSAAVWLRRDLAQHFYDTLSGVERDQVRCGLARRMDSVGRDTARALAQRARVLRREDVAVVMDALADAPAPEVGSCSARAVMTGALSGRSIASTVGTFAGQVTALVTGAGPGSIALSVVAQLLAKGARVVVTTSKYNDDRLALFRGVYREHARPGAELHVVALNQGSFVDVDSLVPWLAEHALTPDLLLPFAALGESGTLRDVGPRSLATLRIQLVGVQRLMANLAAQRDPLDQGPRCHCVLPLSPNHGLFGGDGLYGESKAALEVLCARWRSEQHAWGHAFSLVGAKIGWVRGTGLMASNDPLADALTRDHGLTTFDTDEMASELLALCSVELRALAACEPVMADLTAGLASIGDLGALSQRVRERTEAQRKERAKSEALDAVMRDKTHDAVARNAMIAPTLSTQRVVSIPTESDLAQLPALDHLALDQVAVIVGFGEVSPWGSARSRWAAECDASLSLDALYELAWITGLVETRADGAVIDRASKQVVHIHELRERYENAVQNASGIRLVVGSEAHGFDPARQLRHTEVHIDQPMSYLASSRESAERAQQADPAHVRLEPGPNGAIRVRCLAGASVRIASTSSLRRRVVGQVPDQWDATRYGIPKAMIEQVDRVTLFNLVATVEAFLAAGIEPEELYEHLHITRVGTTQSSGIGGMQKLRRLYHDPMLDRERQSDVLQETLINVISGWMVQAYVGSYGPISSPVGACATAALSVAEAMDMLATGRADFVVTGGCDDYNEEGAVGFSDMGATADSLDAQARGITPRSLSRPNDRRRMGFVEAQGAGAMLVCRGSLAVKMGLPVYGVVAFAASHSDGINASVPAPGQGILGVAAEPAQTKPIGRDRGSLAARRDEIAKLESSRASLVSALGEESASLVISQAKLHLSHGFAREHSAMSPLRAALSVYGLEADDIAFVSKHDTSTNANDSNESKLHTRLAAQLGRTPNLPLHVISQKSLTGHSKGAAAAWQMIGALQAMRDGVVPANRSLEDVAPSLQSLTALSFSDVPVQTGAYLLRAALVTSLGFGHVGALVCVLHPWLFWRAMQDEVRAEYVARLVPRTRQIASKTARVLAGIEPMYTRRTERPFVDKESSEVHANHEAEVLLNASARRTGARFERGLPT